MPGAEAIHPIKPNAVDPQAHLADILTRLVNRHSASQIDLLMHWACAAARPEVL